MTFTPGVNNLPLLPHLCGIYPTPFCDSTNRQISPLPLCGIQYRMISTERSAAFDRCGGICYNKNTKGNTADRRSAPIKLLTKKWPYLWLGRSLFCVVYVRYQDRNDDSKNHQNNRQQFIVTHKQSLLSRFITSRNLQPLFHGAFRTYFSKITHFLLKNTWQTSQKMWRFAPLDQ